MTDNSLVLKKMVGEFLGCFFLGSIGLFTIYQGIVYGAATVAEIGIMFGICIMFAVVVAAPLSGAVLNPAITIAQALFKRIPWKQVLPLIIAQVLGWFLGCLLLIAMTNSSLLIWEQALSITRGNATDVYSAQIFMCNMPNMLMALGLGAGLDTGLVSWPLWACIANEIMCSILLTLAVLVFTDPRIRLRPELKNLSLYLGLIVALAIGAMLAGSTACMNPARDLGPRIALHIFGWESAFPGLGWNSGGYWWIWWIVPVLGATLAAVIHYYMIGKNIVDDEMEDAK